MGKYQIGASEPRSGVSMMMLPSRARTTENGEEEEGINLRTSGRPLFLLERIVVS